MKLPRRSPGADLALPLLFASLVSLCLYIYAVHRAGGIIFSYLPWNLLLAWLPLGIVAVLIQLLRSRSWSSWPALIATTLWLIFLPNSFYMVTDIIHLQAVDASEVVADAVLFTSFVFSGLLLGFTSLYLVHRELQKRLSSSQALAWVSAMLAACSVAIYVGRDLRWNSWDVLFSPAGLLFDLSDKLTHPSQYGDILSVSLSFFVLLAGLYFTIWRLLVLTRRSAARD